MEEWKEYKLGDCVEAVIDNRGKSAPTKPLGDFPLLEINSIGGYYPNYSVVRKYVDIVTYNTWFRSGHPICGDILIPTVGTIGIISIMDNHKACIAQNLIALRTKKDISNIFIYYFLKSPIVKKQLLNLDIGGVQPSIKVPHLLNLSISLPEKDIQYKIASILSSLDDKIELNRKINANLEAQAQALFKSWFVDFEPFKDQPFVESELGMIPEGWRVGKLGELCTFKRGKNLLTKDAIDEGVPVVAGGLEPSCYHNVSNTKSPVVTVSGSGANAGFMRMYYQEVWASDCSFIDSTCENLLFVYCFLSVNRRLLRHAQTGAVQPHVKPSDIHDFDIVIPPKRIVEEFQTKIQESIQMRGNIEKENSRLASLRDTLLPRLMSGELKVNEIVL